MSWISIGRGLEGWHADAKGTSLRTYDTTPEPPQRLLDEAEEGCWVYDAGEADADTFARFVSFGPVCSADLEPGTVDTFTAEDLLLALALCGPGGLSGGYDSLVYLETHQAVRPPRPYEYGSLDSVAVDVWVDMLVRHVRGVRVGRVHGGKVTWEEGRS